MCSRCQSANASASSRTRMIFTAISPRRGAPQTRAAAGRQHRAQSRHPARPGCSSSTLSKRIIVALAASRLAMPDRAGIEGGQRPLPRFHVVEAAQPDEAVRIVEVAELADDGHALGLLALDEMAVEDVDQRVARAGMQVILAELDDRRESGFASLRGIVRSPLRFSVRLSLGLRRLAVEPAHVALLTASCQQPAAPAHAHRHPPFPSAATRPYLRHGQISVEILPAAGRAASGSASAAAR